MIILNFDKIKQYDDIVILQFGGETDPQDKNLSITGGVSLSLSVNGKLSYDSDVFRGLVCESAIKNESTKRLNCEKMAVVSLSNPLNASFQAIFETDKRIERKLTSSFDTVNKIALNSNVKRESTKRLSYQFGSGFETLDFVQQNHKMRQKTGYLLGFWRAFLSEYMAKVYANFGFGRETAKIIGKNSTNVNGFAKIISADLTAKRETAKLFTAWFVAGRGKDEMPVIPVELPLIKLHFACEWGDDTTLIFGTSCQPKIDNDGVIFVVNEVALTRADGRTIEMFSFDVGIDNNSYCWAFSANIPMAEFDKVDIFSEPQINVELSVNGHRWRFMLDGLQQSQSFNNNSLTIKGKSRSLLLSSPYSSQRGFRFDNLTSRQIAESELNRNHVPSGFSIDWQVGGLVGDIGWQVPVYSYTGRTPINSLTWIADSFGGFINSHPYDDVIEVKANYPIPSWEWQNPNIVLTDSRIVTLSQNRVQKPKYNGVLVAGERDNAVMGLIKRRGTTGGFQPPMVSHDLIFEYSVAIARGVAELSNTGDMGNVSLSMPFYNDLPLLTPSTLIGVQDWVGMTRGIAIRGSVGNRGEIVIEQTLEIERHFDKV